MGKSLSPPLFQNRACHFHGTRLLRYIPLVTSISYHLIVSGSDSRHPFSRLEGYPFITTIAGSGICFPGLIPVYPSPNVF